MELKNSVHYFSYKDLEKRGVSFADFAKRKHYYNRFAFLFEEASTRSPFTKSEVDFVERLALRHTSRSPSFLDVACGVGRHDRELSKRGYSVVGIDASRELLKYARKNDKKTLYKRSDMRTFRLNRKFDCIFSIWDAYVYLSRPKDIMEFLKRCYDHLNPGGILVLDSRNFFAKKWRTARVSHDYFSAKEYNVERFARRKTMLKERVHESVFLLLTTHKRKNKSYLFVDQELVRIYSTKNLRNLFKNRFRIVSMYGEFNPKERYNSSKSERMIVVAQKRRS